MPYQVLVSIKLSVSIAARMGLEATTELGLQTFLVKRLLEEGNDGKLAEYKTADKGRLPDGW